MRSVSSNVRGVSSKFKTILQREKQINANDFTKGKTNKWKLIDQICRED